MHTEQEKLDAAISTMAKAGWPVEYDNGTPLLLSEGNLGVTCFNAGYDFAAATSVSGGAGDWLPIFPGADLPALGESVLLLNNFGAVKLAPRWGKLALDVDEHYWELDKEPWAFSNFTHYLRVPTYPSVEATIRRAALAASPANVSSPQSEGAVSFDTNKLWAYIDEVVELHTSAESGQVHRHLNKRVIEELAKNLAECVNPAAARPLGVAEPGGWVPVGERLPVAGRKVLILIKPRLRPTMQLK